MKITLLTVLILFSSYALSDTVQQNKLNAFYLTQDNKTESIALLLHGTRGHQNLELISSLRESLLDIGIDSLSINLSYGIEDRNNDFLPCDIHHQHTVKDSLDEIKLWYKFISNKGYTKLYLIGHSRGALDILNFYLNERDDLMNPDIIFLLAPIIDSDYDHKINYQANHNIDIESINIKDNLSINFLGCEKALVSGKTFKSYYYNPETKSLTEALESSSIQIRVITGSEDTITPNTHQAVQDLVSVNKNIRLFQIEDSDHFFRDFYFDDLMEIISTEVEK
jgi:pimeloyl-ACP methyl ester carboxylesterase